MTQFNITILKTQNHGLVTRLNTAKSRLGQAAAFEDQRRTLLADSSQAVDSFTTTMRRVTGVLIKLFESILQARSYSSLGEEGRPP